jgi:hypothetical protein
MSKCDSAQIKRTNSNHAAQQHPVPRIPPSPRIPQLHLSPLSKGQELEKQLKELANHNAVGIDDDEEDKRWQFARRLSKREDTRRVESNGFNHFRQTYEMEGSWRKVKRIIDRYILSAGDRILPQNSLQNASNLGGRVMTADITCRGILSAGDHDFAEQFSHSEGLSCP